LNRIEPGNNIKFAAKAIVLAEQIVGQDLRAQFLADLEQAKSWRTGVTGRDIFEKLISADRAR